MSSSERILRPSVWAIYTIIVFEILFMISPFALYFYSVYGPVLRFFDQWAATAWLTQFFLPHISETRSPFLNILHGLACVAVGFTLRDYSLSSITAFYTPEAAVLSPALLRDDELKAAYRTATADARVHKALQAVGPAKSIVYVVPLKWCLPDLPLEATRTCYGHYVPVDFDRRYYKLLFTRARTHAAQASGKNIVKTAYGLHPIVLVKVDISSLEVTGVETPPPHVFWGDIPTPLF